MIVETRYICEKCGLKYAIEEEAMACEARHVGIESVEKILYSHSSTNTKYPNNLLVKTEDGQYLNYCFVDALKKEQIEAIFGVPDDPTEPTDEPTEPVEPTDEPVDPTDPIEPTEPITDDTTGTDTTKPTDSTDSTDSTDTSGV